MYVKVTCKLDELYKGHLCYRFSFLLIMKAYALERNVVAQPAVSTKISEAQPGEMVAGSTNISSASFSGGIMILIATIFESLLHCGLCGKDFTSLASFRATPTRSGR